MKTGRRSRPWPLVLLVLTSVVLALAAGEVLVRATWSEQARPRPKPLDPELRDLPRLSGVLTLGKPNQRGIFGGVLHETNSAGFRGREYTFVKPENVFRIVVIGDSITMGQGVDRDATYAALLERKLNATRTDPVYEVLNLGIAGLNARVSIQARLKRIGLRFDPDMVVYGFTLNDIEDQSYRRFDKHKTYSADFKNARSHLWKLLTIRFRYLRELIAPPTSSYVYELDHNYFNNSDAWQELTAELGDLSDLTRSWKMCGVVFIHTRMHILNWLHPYTRHYAKVSRAALDAGLFVIEPSAAFMGERDTTLWVSPIDVHPNSRAHATFAEELLKGLETLPAECWRRRTGPPALRSY